MTYGIWDNVDIGRIKPGCHTYYDFACLMHKQSLNLVYINTRISFAQQNVTDWPTLTAQRTTYHSHGLVDHVHDLGRLHPVGVVDDVRNIVLFAILGHLHNPDRRPFFMRFESMKEVTWTT